MDASAGQYTGSHGWIALQAQRELPMIIVAALLRGDETAIDHPHHITEVIKKTRRDAAQTPDVGTSFYEFSPRGFIERDIKNLGTIEGTIGKGTIFLWVSGRSWTKK
jgi:hypothetical protein